MVIDDPKFKLSYQLLAIAIKIQKEEKKRQRAGRRNAYTLARGKKEEEGQQKAEGRRKEDKVNKRIEEKWFLEEYCEKFFPLNLFLYPMRTFSISFIKASCHLPS